MKNILLTGLALTLFISSVWADNCKGKTAADGKKQGLWKCFYEDGTLQEEGKYKDDLKIGEWKFYHANGELALTGNYIDGVEKGVWTMYDDEGGKLDVIDYGS